MKGRVGAAIRDMVDRIAGDDAGTSTVFERIVADPRNAVDRGQCQAREFALAEPIMIGRKISRIMKRNKIELTNDASSGDAFEPAKFFGRIDLMRPNDEVEAISPILHDVRNHFGRNVGRLDDFGNDVLRSMFGEKNCKRLIGATLGQ